MCAAMRFSKKVQKLGSYYGIMITKSEAEELGINENDRVANVAIIVDSVLAWAGKKKLYRFFDRYIIQLPKTKVLGVLWSVLHRKDKDVIIIISKDDDRFMEEISEYVVKTFGYRNP